MVPGGIDALDPGDIDVPTMVIGSELDGTTGFPASLEAYARLAGPRYLVKLLGGGHLSVVDDCFPLCGTLDREKGHRLVLRYALPFFRRWLMNARGADVSQPSRAAAAPSPPPAPPSGGS